MKISSDIFVLDENVLGCGIGQNIYTVDIREKKITHNISHTQEGNILCFQFDPISPFGFCTSGTDFSIKFWDIRKPEKEMIKRRGAKIKIELDLINSKEIKI